MISIRKYEDKDFDGVRYACLNSEGEEIKGDLGEFILCTFCDYYIEHEKENCFVLDDNGKAVGYVICAEDYDRYKDIFDSEYLPKVENQSEKRYKWAKESTVLHSKHKDNYPAHLHIDILPDYQRKGWGGKLINTLCEHLSKKGVKGVMLTTGTANTNACNFYKKYGFEQLEICDTDIAFGKRL